MNKDTEKIKNRYNRISPIYDLMEGMMESGFFTNWRKDIIQELEGKVLEAGVGTGKNIEYYPNNLDITAIDFSHKMLLKAAQKRMKHDKKVKLIQMDIQDMDFNDNSFNTIFSSFVFCSVPDPIKGLEELRRVCKKNGKIILLEHVRSEKKIMGLLMDIMNPIPLHVYGANINRRTLDNVYKAGLSNVHVTRLYKDIVLKIVITND